MWIDPSALIGRMAATAVISGTTGGSPYSRAASGESAAPTSASATPAARLIQNSDETSARLKSARWTIASPKPRLPNNWTKPMIG